MLSCPPPSFSLSLLTKSHSGPVVSNVIGSLNPRYGLFGDTVNTSSRMESNSKANRILCSEAAFKLLNKQAPEISTKKRGKIAVKGKGDMVVWYVNHLLHSHVCILFGFVGILSLTRLFVYNNTGGWVTRR